MIITVVGTGYVGLVTGACFAEMGNTVTCVDIDETKIDNLRKGILPIFEPGLEDVVLNNHSQDRLLFSTSLSASIQSSEVIFIAVGTPPGEDGSADLRYVLAVATEIGRHLSSYAVIVDKSTVPVGTAEKVSSAIKTELERRNVEIDFDVVSNPEFLKEGAALKDFMSPDRIIVGAETIKARQVMADLYAPFTRNHPRTIFMGVRDAELTKYAANAMLATKISFMNEISNICEKLNVDVENVRLGIGSDNRIGFDFIYPGAGYGGSCFPKDVKALIRMAREVDISPSVLEAVEKRNDDQKILIYKKIKNRFEDKLSGLSIGIWGLSFKPGTDDMREAPSVGLISSLLSSGATVRAFDPVAMIAAKSEFDQSYFETGALVFCADQYSVLESIDVLVLITEWKQFRHPNFEKMRDLMRSPVIFDGRNLYDPILLRRIGFEYSGIGREFSV